jgi:CRISPR-associated protein Csc3
MIDTDSIKYTQTKILYSFLKDGNSVMASFIANCGDKLIENFTLKSAKGGNWAKERKKEGKDVSKCSYDQNMTTHISNGLYPTFDLLEILEKKEIINPSKLEKQIYILSYTLHDIDKVWGKSIDTSTKENIDLFKTELLEYSKKLNFHLFLPEIDNYIGDIAFLVVNTQLNWGANLDDYNFGTKLDKRKRNFIRELCKYSDRITYGLKSPSDILADNSISAILAAITDDKIKLFYHKVPEVRGLITNVINNSIMNIYENNGFTPYLYFTNGVVYLGDTSLKEPALDIDYLFENVKVKLSGICGKKIKKDKPGFKFTNLSTTKNPEYYFDFLDLPEYMNLVVDKAIRPTGADPSKSMVQHFNKLTEIDKTKFIYNPDEKIGGIGRYLIFIDDNIVQNIKDKDETYNIIFNTLELNEYKNDFLSLRNAIEKAGGLGKISGGTKIEWFYIGGKFLEKHRGIEFDSVDGDKCIRVILENLNKALLEKYGDILNESGIFKGVYLNSLYQYLKTFNLSNDVSTFSKELEKYTNSKKIKKGEIVCTICNSSYEMSLQDESSVPFQASVFKNKLPLFKSSSTGSICNICSLEFMLRQILIKGVKLTGSGFSDLKAKYFYFYPNYFFTTTTHKFIRRIFEKSKNINIFKIKNAFENALKNNDLSLKLFLDCEEHVLEPFGEVKDTSFLKMEYPEKEIMTMMLTGMKGEDSDTASWAVPSFLGMFYYLLINAKVVVTDSLLPIYNSQQEIKETVIFDAPHQAIKYIIPQRNLNLDEVYENLVKLMSVYSIHIDVYSDGGKPNWSQLGDISKNIATDLISVFKFLKKKQRKDGRDSIYRDEAITYIEHFKILGGEKVMEVISEIVDSYARFYRPKGYSSYGIVRPVGIVADMIIKNDSETLKREDTLKLFLEGELRRWANSVINDNAKGIILLRGHELEKAIEDFVNLFFKQVYKDYCKSEVAFLRSKLNQFSGGCEAYFVKKYMNKKTEEETVNA